MSLVLLPVDQDKLGDASRGLKNEINKYKFLQSYRKIQPTGHNASHHVIYSDDGLMQSFNAHKLKRIKRNTLDI